MKKILDFFKELRKKTYGKSVMFFGFYLIFFIVIFIILGLGGSNKKNNKEASEYKSLFNNNYSFTYKVILDGDSYLYNINKNSNTYSFIYDNKQYTGNGKNTYNNEIVVENPVRFSDFYNEELLIKILKNSYFESKTTYGSGDIVYNFLISSNTLNKLVYGKNTDYEEVPNKLKVSISKGKIGEIDYNLDSYCKINNLCNNNLSINVKYNDFNNEN